MDSRKNLVAVPLEEFTRDSYGLNSEPTELVVAVKKLDKTERDGGEREFQAEVTAIGRTNHKNLVQLLGFCNEEQNRLLVYEYMMNGSLARFLFGKSKLNWYQRIQIALGTARGLCYLHEECSSQILHCDIKPQNILLDDSFTAKISDFGLAKLMKVDQSQTTTAIRGTKGYVAPEWFRNMPITVEVDVYSHGILLLELICCRKNCEPDLKEQDQIILANWAYDCYIEGKLNLLVEKETETLDDIERVKKFVMVAIWCIQEGPISETYHEECDTNADFAFGFRQIGTGLFILAIWFNNIPEATIIWSANGENLVQEGSRIELTTDGQFVLSDSKGKEVWTATLPGAGAAYAAMLDTGNFVLASEDSTILWQSFDQPTDTILPTQQLNQGNKLVARYSETNYSSGRFEFTLKTDGNLVLYTRDFPLDSENAEYWSSKTVGSDFQVIFNQSGYIYLIAKNGSILNSIASTGASSSDFYQRAILEYDGVFRQYVYPKTDSSSTGRSMSWSLLGDSIPSDICMSIRQETGSGACGFNSYCVLGTDQRPTCECPDGYSYLDPDNKMNGCKQDFVSQDCGSVQEANLFSFRDMPNTDWPLSDYEHFSQVFEDWCRQACLDDCFCAVAIFRDGDCWKKKIPLSNGRRNPIVGGKALIKVRQENSTGCKSIDGGSNKKDQSTLILVGSVLLSSSVFFNFLLLIGTLFIVLRFNNRRKKMFQHFPAMHGMSLRCFTYKELEEASSMFKEELGRGAFSTVYKGVLDNKSLVAIKRLEKVQLTEGEKEFEAEMNTIGKTNHKNLVQLLGFCNEGKQRLLVYQYMSNGSLADYLFGNSRPLWQRRKQIAVKTARGLAYLHEECINQIIHCDIKPQNVLLDESFTPRISDFGLAKLLKTDQTRTMTGIRGTKGYVAPEWFKSMPITVKVDVYSFGILLLELICCRKNFEQNIEDESQMVLVDWVYDCYEARKLSLIVEKDEEALQDFQVVQKFVMIAIWCIQDDPSLRPTMKRVIQMLEGDVEVPLPPATSSFVSSIYMSSTE